MQPSTPPRFSTRLFARRVSTALIVGALVIGAYPVVTALLGEWRARGLDNEFADAMSDFDTSGISGTTDDELLASSVAQFRSDLLVGRPIGQITIPSIDLETVIVQGSKKLGLNGFDDTLDVGPAHMAWTSLPGEGGNFAVAGHRTTYTRPFWSLNKVKKGDTIEVLTPYAKFTYTVRRKFEVSPSAIEVTKDVGPEVLTLSTCTPRFTASRRLIVRATLDKYELTDAVLAQSGIKAPTLVYDEKGNAP